ncbi:hypothetical protein EJB05_22882, partial [Eragrostis curvula]
YFTIPAPPTLRQIHLRRQSLIPAAGGLSCSRRSISTEAKGSSTLGGSRHGRRCCRFFSEIRDIKEELESMQSFLQGAERFKDTDNTTANFIKNI